MATVQVGNLDVTFSPNVSWRVQMAFLQYPTPPAKAVQRSQSYAIATGARPLGAPPTPNNEPAVGYNKSDEARMKRGRHQATAANDASVSHRGPTLRALIDDVEAGPGLQNSTLLTARNRPIPVGIGLPAAAGKNRNGISTRKATGFNLRREAAKGESLAAPKEKVAVLRLQEKDIGPKTSNQRRIEIASMPFPLGG